MWDLDCEESRVLKNWCFWTVVLDKTLESPLDFKEIHQSILKEISPGCSLERLMLKLKLQYFGHLMRRVDSLEQPWCWEGLEAGGEGEDRGWDGRMASLTRCTWVWVNSWSWWWTWRPGMLWFMGSQRVGHNWVTELNWTNEIGNSFPCESKQLHESVSLIAEFISPNWFVVPLYPVSSLLSAHGLCSVSL